MKNILVVAAHPDDEILGCGGTMASLSKDFDIHTLIMGEGVTSREGYKKGEVSKLKKACLAANKLVGAKEVFFNDRVSLGDNMFDRTALLEIIKSISFYKDKVKPSMVFTHHRRDLNVDHQMTYQAVITACRPMKDETVRTIYSFEVPSSTEWSFPLSFSPNVFIDVTGYHQKKLEALETFYIDELRESPHPRSILAVSQNMSLWGERIGCENAEAFELVRMIT